MGCQIMLRSLAIALCIAAASAFSPAQLPLRSRNAVSSAPVCAMSNPAAQLSKVGCTPLCLQSRAGYNIEGTTPEKDELAM